MEYKNLSKFEKFKEFKEYNFWRGERSVAAEYLKALWLNDVQKISYFEDFGSSPSKIISNYRQYQRNLLFGFNDIIFDDYEWFKRPVLLEKETIYIYKMKDSYINVNSIDIGRGKNNVWTYGYSLSNNTSGRHSGACVWGEKLLSKELAIEKACLKMIEFHENNKSSISSKVIKLAEERIAEMKRAKQLSLF